MRVHLTYLTAVLFITGCAGGDDPRAIADAFWTASKEGDVERAKTYVAEGSTAKIQNPDESGSSVGEFTLGESAIDGDRATVETTVTSAGTQEMELSFQTVLVRQEGAWKVDLDQTTGEMMKSLFGGSMGDFAEKMGQAMGEALGEGMKAMGEGMAQGLKAAADSLEKTGRR
jgi:hypothetical protein